MTKASHMSTKPSLTQLSRPTSVGQLTLFCRTALQAQGNWLLGVLAPIVEQRIGTSTELRLQFWWTVFTIQRRGGELLIQEPDYLSDPANRRTSDLTFTLTLTARQRDLLAEVGAQPNPAMFNHQVVVTKGWLAKPRLYLERSAPQAKDDSGWFIGPGEDGEEEEPEYQSKRVFEVVKERPELIPILALPEGYSALVGEERIHWIVDPAERVVKPGA